MNRVKQSIDTLTMGLDYFNKLLPLAQFNTLKETQNKLTIVGIYDKNIDDLLVLNFALDTLGYKVVVLKTDRDVYDNIGKVDIFLISLNLDDDMEGYALIRNLWNEHCKVVTLIAHLDSLDLKKRFDTENKTDVLFKPILFDELAKTIQDNL